jgi:hypothetical protein
LLYNVTYLAGPQAAYVERWAVKKPSKTIAAVKQILFIGFVF